MKKLYEYVNNYATRGECQCGKCIDKGNKSDPIGHTINTTFFKVGKSGNSNKLDFKDLLPNELKEFKGEKGYMEIGGILGDQGFALLTMGLGHLLGVWELMSPDTIMPFLNDSMKQQMAGNGMVTIKWIT